MSIVQRGAPNAEKGTRYLGLLEQALCNGEWSDVAELARKVDKHAPDRKAFACAARAEAQIASALNRPTSTSADAAASIHSLSELVQQLKGAANVAHKTRTDDAYIATTCTAMIYWLREDFSHALSTLDEDDTTPPSRAFEEEAAALRWLEICAIKRDLIRADSLDSAARQREAFAIYQAAAVRLPDHHSREVELWTERLLARACMHNFKRMSSPVPKHVVESYVAFKAWGDFWQRTPLQPVTAVSAFSRLDLSRRVVWKSYYDLLSILLRNGFVYNTSSTSMADLLVTPGCNVKNNSLTAARRAQYVEFRRVESTYESVLLNETSFPKSNQTNVEVEHWVEQVITNWQILCGPHWPVTDLCDGGREAISRGVLDILYRAATKTFHSTAVLRRLFQVHAALGEFDLAMHAFDSYVEVIDRGKARAEKTGKHETGFDDDDTAVQTAVEAVRILCRYGDDEKIEKVGKVSATIQTWLSRELPDVTKEDLEVEGQPEDAETRNEAHLKSVTLAGAYRAVGIYHAQLARQGFEKGARQSLLAEANNNLRRAHKFEPDNIETAYALALVLAEMRDVNGAVEVIKDAVAAQCSSSHTDEAGPQISTSGSSTLVLAPMWHLLALCLTARDQHEGAARLCETAFDSFGGSEIIPNQFSTNNAKKQSFTSSSKLELLSNFEKEAMIQVKMTQIVLLELTDGPEDAVNLADELLSLHTSLFGGLENATLVPAKPPSNADTAASPKRGGTLRSIAGSIRPRSVRSGRLGSERDYVVKHPATLTDASQLTSDSQFMDEQTFGAPIEITITSEDGVPSGKPHEYHRHVPHLHFRGHRDGTNGQDQSDHASGLLENSQFSSGRSTEAITAAVSQSAPSSPRRHLTDYRPQNGAPLLSGHGDLLAQQDTRLPSHAESHVSVLQARRHKIGLLIKIWLFIAATYIHAGSYEDAQSAIDDATNWVESLELELSRSASGSSARSLFLKGWGGGKGVDELWADLWSVKAQLSLSRIRPFDAIANYEQALSYFPDHPTAIIGISNLLMDQYEGKIPAEEPVAPLPPYPLGAIGRTLISEARPTLTRPNSSVLAPSRKPSCANTATVLTQAFEEIKERRMEPSSAELNRLAARDRAYMLLMNLTKMGIGWDNSEAWLTLARVHELSREIGKAKNALWWVVELEESRPLRDWREVNPGGYTL